MVKKHDHSENDIRLTSQQKGNKTVDHGNRSGCLEMVGMHQVTEDVRLLLLSMIGPWHRP